MRGQDRLGEDALGEVARWVVSERPLDQVLDRVAEVARSAIPAADEASITLVATPHDLTVGATSDTARALDERQRDLGRGPCLDAAYGGTSVVVADMGVDDRWPKYTPRALELGIRSSLSSPLPTQEHVVAAINWYAARPGAFSSDDIPAAEEFTARVAVAVTNAHLYANATIVAKQMQDAMQSRAVIEQAKGILMAHSDLTPDEAFDTLARASQRENRKLREVATDIVAKRGRPAP